MTMTTLIKKTFNWSDSLTVSEVQFIIFMPGKRQYAGSHGVGYILTRRRKEIDYITGWYPEHRKPLRPPQ